MIEKIASHIADFTPRLRSNTRALYQYCPIPVIQYPQLENELFCNIYYLRHLCDTQKFPDWPILDPVCVLKIALWNFVIFFHYFLLFVKFWHFIKLSESLFYLCWEHLENVLNWDLFKVSKIQYIYLLIYILFLLFMIVSVDMLCYTCNFFIIRLNYWKMFWKLGNKKWRKSHLLYLLMKHMKH